MALTKPPVLPAWADAGDKVQPSNAEIQVGWPLSNTPPARQRWNWLLNFLANGVRYLTRRGLPDYGDDETYMIGDRVIGDDGKTYRSVQDNNTGNTPSTSPLWWERWGYSAAELVDVINAKKATFVVRAASTAAINLAAPGANIDGVAMVAGDLFLEKDNGTGAARGIYVWNGAAAAATRAPEADAGTELKPGILVEVTEGTTNADTLWSLTTDGAVTVGVTALTFAPMARVISTPAQFDNSTKLATTAFVKSAGLQSSGAAVVTATGAHAASDYGSTQLLAPTVTITRTMPAANAAPAGSRIEFMNTGTANATIQRAGTDTFAVNGGANVTSITLGPGDTLTLVTNGVGVFFAVAGVAQLGFSGVFGASLASSGYQKLPSGLIVQWGSLSVSAGATASGSVTLPITYPSAGLFVGMTPGELNGDTAYGSAPGAGNKPLCCTSFLTSTAAFSYDVRTPDGSALTTSNGLALNWFSLGK